MERGLPEGDETPDATVGLLGMVEVVTGTGWARNPSGGAAGSLKGPILGRSLKKTDEF
jgi:hypothetical protein